MTDLWSARLDIESVPPTDDLSWDPTVADPLGVAGTRAMDMHEMFEAPPHQSRQSRATLYALAMLALRKAE